ncbi:uncharacterized protein LOC116023520 [Ipomoea triloba]|uniref:uncharacterized protein LOC116023520 n=1 Tax=Ipomoea triloba TaxID=35885 RepID=UPI00125D02E1|nr:uncharacterized protein LOC116023520 [Ipomoea triloba]
MAIFRRRIRKPKLEDEIGLGRVHERASKAYDEYDDPPRRQISRTQYDDREYGDYHYSTRAPPPPQRRTIYDEPPESYQESYHGHDYEHSSRAQPLRRDTSYDHSREYRTPSRYCRDDYEKDYHDQEDYSYEYQGYKRSASHQSYNSKSYQSTHYDEDDDYPQQRGFSNSQSYNPYPSQAYSPQSYTQNTPPPKKKSIIEHMYDHWLKPKPRDPNDRFKTIEEHMFEDMNRQVTCYACKGPHYRYKHHKDEVDQECNAKPQGKYGLSEETWALARRLGITIVPDDSIEEEVIENTKERGQEIPVIEQMQEQAKGNHDMRYGNTVEEGNEETLDPISGSTTLGDKISKSWADMCDENDDCDDIVMPIGVDNANVDCVADELEKVVGMTSENNCIIEDVDNEVNSFNPCDFNDNDSFDSSDDDDENFEEETNDYVRDVLLSKEKEWGEESVTIEKENEEENFENKNVLFEEVHCKIIEEEKEEIRDESVREEVEEKLPTFGREYAMYKIKGVCQCPTFETYLEERVDGAKGLVPVQYCNVFDDSVGKLINGSKLRG